MLRATTTTMVNVVCVIIGLAWLCWLSSKAGSPEAKVGILVAAVVAVVLLKTFDAVLGRGRDVWAEIILGFCPGWTAAPPSRSVIVLTGTRTCTSPPWRSSSSWVTWRVQPPSPTGELVAQIGTGVFRLLPADAVVEPAGHLC